VCVFHIFLTWPLIDILIECYYTGKSIAYKRPQNCLASSTEFVLLYYQSFKKMYLFLICFKNGFMVFFFRLYVSPLKKDDR